MNQRDTTSRLRSLVLLAGIMMLGITGCDDQLLPPPQAKPGEATREQRVYYNSVDMSLPTTSGIGIRSIRPDGGGDMPITTGYIASSPRMGKMAYLMWEDRDGMPAGIYIANDHDGSNPRLIDSSWSLMEESVSAWTIVLGPDGQTVAWVGADENQMAMLYIKRPDRPRIGVPLDQPFSMDYMTITPEFSPDGSSVAFEGMSSDFTDMRSVIKIVSTYNGGVTQIAVPLYSAMYSAPSSSSFDWSADNQRILYAGFIEDPVGFSYTCQIMATNIFSKRTDTLTNDSLIKQTPRWIPGTNQFVYIGIADDGRCDIYEREPSGSIQRLTPQSSDVIAGLSISSDGRSLLYLDVPSLNGDVAHLRTFDRSRRTGTLLSSDAQFGYWRR